MDLVTLQYVEMTILHAMGDKNPMFKVLHDVRSRIAQIQNQAPITYAEWQSLKDERDALKAENNKLKGK
jgi:cell division protein FtsB